MMNIVLLSGGSGKRLWPLSNEVRSKQFLRLLTDESGIHVSMVQRVYKQIQEAGIEANIVVATSATQKDSIRIQLGKKVDVVIEPERRNTFPAIVLTSSYLLSEKKSGLDETVIVLPVDPYVDIEYFEMFKKMDEEVQKGESEIVLMGLKPLCPSSKYGYAIVDSRDNKTVKGFREKPTEAEAEDMIRRGALWNAGVFAFKLSYVKAIINNYLENSDYDYVFQNYALLNKNSFDYEVVEKAKSISIMKYEGKWLDIGTWNTLTEVMGETSIGNVIVGEESEDIHVINELSIPIITLGIKNAVIAASPDGILISDKDKSSYLKPYVEQIDNRPMYEENIWGEYKILDYTQYSDNKKSLTKQIVVKSGRYLDYVCHAYREETWVVVSGKGFIVLDGMTTIARSGDVFHFHSGDKHGLKAITDIHIIEVQVGEELSEEDILIYDWPDER